MATGHGIRPDRGSRLNSWKEIAAYFERGITTVQRWEREEGLPVHRLAHDSGSSVYAFENELAEWQGRRTRKPGADAPAATELPERRLFAWKAAALAFGGLTLLAAVWNLPRPAANADHRIVPVAVTPDMELEPDLSPDGRRITFVQGGPGAPRRVVVRELASGQELHSWDGPVRVQFPQWSPDGAKMLYSQVHSDIAEVFIRDLRAGTARRILTMVHPAYQRQRSVRWAVWAADGKTIYISRKGEGTSPYAIYSYSTEGQELAQITQPRAGIAGDQQFAASRDGKWLAFTRYETGTESDIYVVPSSGGAARRLTFNNSYHHGLAWMPDNSSIIYSARKSGPANDLWRVPVSGGKSVPVVSGEINATWASVAPAPGGGLRVAYSRNIETVNVRHWPLPAASAEPRSACPSTYREGSAQYSPDGGKLAFTSIRSGDSEIWTCDLRSGQARRVTNFGGPHTDSPRWSPDGRMIAFTSFEKGSRNIYLADLATGKVSPFLASPADEGRASWSRDGKWIYFRSDRSGRDEIWKASTDGSQPVQVTKSGAYEAFESPDGKRLFFTRDRSKPGLWSMPVEGGEERFETPDVREGWWGTSAAGTYFLHVTNFHQIWRFDPVTRERALVATISPQNNSIWTGFAVNPQGTAVAWPQTTAKVDDILMLDTVRF